MSIFKKIPLIIIYAIIVIMLGIGLIILIVWFIWEANLIFPVT